MSAPADPPLIEVLKPAAYASRRAVIEGIGDAMIAVGAVTPAYVDGMLRKELHTSTVVTAEVALPHGTPDVRSEVVRNVLVVAPIKGSVEWTPGTPVRVAIGFAGTGDDAHLRLLSSVARVLADAELLERLKNGDDVPRVAALFV
jgi:mannitol/fructose-specific phosphotransferase system IIA component